MMPEVCHRIRIPAAALLLTFTAPAAAGDWDRQYEGEATRIAPFADRVHRAGDTLYLGLEGGDEVKLTNPPTYCDAPEGCIVYGFEGYLSAANSYVIEVSYYEGGEYMLVDASTGAETKIGAIPHIDPSGTRFIAVGTSEMEGELNGFEMWSLMPAGPRMDWRHETTELFTFRTWHEPGTIELSHWVWSDALNKYVPIGAELTQTETGWRLAKAGTDQSISVEGQ